MDHRGPATAPTLLLDRVPVAAPATPAASGPSRLAALDGLRGLAALVVVVHHCALTLPTLAQQLPHPTAPR